MYALPPLTQAAYPQSRKPVSDAKLRTRELTADDVVHTGLISGARLAHILCHHGSCVEQKCKGGGGGESHGEEIMQGINEQVVVDLLLGEELTK